MKISNEIKTRWIELVHAGAERDVYPAHRLLVRLFTENLQADYEQAVWISEKSIEDFLNSALVLHEERKNSVQLEGMSPGEFLLAFKPVDAMGHLLVQLRLKKEDRLGRDYSFAIDIEFQVDPTCLPGVVKDFFEMVRPA